MGQITIDIRGSFGRKNGVRNFSAMRHGHADAVAQAIEYLSSEVLPFATALDHKLHAEGSSPNRGFDRQLATDQDAEKEAKDAALQNSTV